jgi:hypothetical protein
LTTQELTIKALISKEWWNKLEDSVKYKYWQEYSELYFTMSGSYETLKPYEIHSIYKLKI